MFEVTLLLAVLLAPGTIAQAPPPPPPAAVETAAPYPEILDNGPCLDSPRAVPQVLQEPVVHEMQIVRIDKVVSTSTMTYGDIIGFLYTTPDGSTWLGQRTPEYMSAADAHQIDQLLASTHASAGEPNAFPPTMRYGVPVHAQQYFRVRIPQSAFVPLRIRIDPCVAWPPDRRLPDPSF